MRAKTSKNRKKSYNNEKKSEKKRSEATWRDMTAKKATQSDAKKWIINQISCQGRGGLGKGGPPQPKFGGSGGQRPPAKNISETFEKKIKKQYSIF